MAGVFAGTLLLTGCGGSSPITLPSTSRTALPTLSPNLPTRTGDVAPSPSANPTSNEPEITTSTDPDSPSRTTDSDSPSTSKPPKPTAETTTVTTTATATATATHTADRTLTVTASSTTSVTATGGSGVQSWVWWLIAALVLAAAVAIPLIVRSRRRAAWRTELAQCEGEVAWFSRELLPQLQQAPTAEMAAGGWAVQARRVTEVEDRLTTLRSSAPDETGRNRAKGLRDAVRGSRVRIESLLAPGVAPELVRTGLAGVQTALETSLNPPAPPGPGAPQTGRHA
jgi:hypothetical protein